MQKQLFRLSYSEECMDYLKSQDVVIWNGYKMSGADASKRVKNTSYGVDVNLCDGTVYVHAPTECNMW